MALLNNFESAVVCAENKVTGIKVYHLLRNIETGKSLYWLYGVGNNIFRETLGDLIAFARTLTAKHDGLDDVIYQLGG